MFIYVIKKGIFSMFKLIKELSDFNKPNFYKPTPTPETDDESIDDNNIDDNEHQSPSETTDNDVDIDVTVDKPEEQDYNDYDKQNKQGIIRYIKGAHLVFKRKNPDGLYDELWMFKTSNLKDDENIKQTIIAGTDIDKTVGESEDGVQTYDMWTSGDITILKILNLPE